MLNKLEDLKRLEQALLGLKAQMSVTFLLMDEIDVLNIDKNISKASKEEIEVMNDINKLLSDADKFWNKTLL